MKWPDDLEFGEPVIIITSDVVNHAGDETISFALAEYDSDDPSLVAVLRIPS